jgi:hypothetical protein
VPVGLSLGSHHLLDPPRHRVVLLFAVVLSEACGPQELGLHDQLGHRAGVLLLVLTLHEAPHVLNSIQVRAIARPIRLVTLKFLLGNEIFHPHRRTIESGLQAALYGELTDGR